MRRTMLTLLVVAATAAMAVGLLAGCGGGGTATYTNDKYGFTFDYDSGLFTENKDISTASAVGGNSALQVGFFDENGTKQGDQYRDGFLLGLYQLNTTIDASLMPEFGQLLEQKVLPELGKAFGSGVEFTALKAVDVDGTSGFTTDATFKMDGTAFKATMYFLIKDDMEYQFTMQGAESRWSELEPGFQQVIDTFTVK
jgi:hypothetical protein